MISLGLLLLCAGSVLSQFQCPPDNGYYGDPQQCDKYYDCYRGTMEEKLCPDGLVFDRDQAPKIASCNYPFIAHCPEGSTLQPPQPSGIECPRQNGYFEHESPENCAEYYECTHGSPVKRSCAENLVFDEYSGTCQWASKELRSGCIRRPLSLEDGFSCNHTATQTHTNGHELDHQRYVNPNDCRMFYVCLNGMYPSVVGCPEGTVFNDLTLNCDDPQNVPGCENYYGSA